MSDGCSRGHSWAVYAQPGAGEYLYTSRIFNHNDDLNEVTMGDQGLGARIGRFLNERGVRKIDGYLFATIQHLVPISRGSVNCDCDGRLMASAGCLQGSRMRNQCMFIECHIGIELRSPDESSKSQTRRLLI